MKIDKFIQIGEKLGLEEEKLLEVVRATEVRRGKRGKTSKVRRRKKEGRKRERRKM